MTIRSTRRTSTFAAFRFAVRAFLAPYFHFLFLGALDTPLAHLSIVLDLGLRELAVFPEDDVKTQADDAEAYKYKCREKYFHP